MKNLAIIALLTAMASIGAVVTACGNDKPAADPTSVGDAGAPVDTSAVPTDTSSAAPTDTAPATGGDAG